MPVCDGIFDTFWSANLLYPVGDVLIGERQDIQALHCGDRQARRRDRAVDRQQHRQQHSVENSSDDHLNSGRSLQNF
eukprot:scaffold9049_cov71-Phaeocystis_antarctica.AAC.3